LSLLLFTLSCPFCSAIASACLPACLPACPSCVPRVGLVAPLSSSCSKPLLNSTSMSSSTTYPPPPQRDPATLYSSSPHLKREKLLRQRNHSTTYTDPFHVVAFILLLAGLFFWKPNLIPFSSSLGITSPSSTTSSLRSGLRISLQPPERMVWQKTFTLPSASRGCHLITSTVEKEISEGLKGCKVISCCSWRDKVCIAYLSSSVIKGRYLDALHPTHIGFLDSEREF
jgi:hypothetical protein